MRLLRRTTSPCPAHTGPLILSGPSSGNALSMPRRECVFAYAFRPVEPVAELARVREPRQRSRSLATSATPPTSLSLRERVGVRERAGVRGHAAFTLVELLVAMVVTAVVGAAAAGGGATVLVNTIGRWAGESHHEFLGDHALRGGILREGGPREEQRQQKRQPKRHACRISEYSQRSLYHGRTDGTPISFRFAVCIMSVKP